MAGHLAINLDENPNLTTKVRDFVSNNDAKSMKAFETIEYKGDRVRRLSDEYLINDDQYGDVILSFINQTAIYQGEVIEHTNIEAHLSADLKIKTIYSVM